MGTIGHVIQRALRKPLGLSTRPPRPSMAPHIHFFFAPKGKSSNLSSRYIHFLSATEKIKWGNSISIIGWERLLYRIVRASFSEKELHRLQRPPCKDEEREGSG